MLNDNFQPRPDYYASLLWKRHMGRDVLSVNVDDSNENLRFYSHCAKKGHGAVLLAINISGQTNKFQLEDFNGKSTMNVLEPEDGLHGGTALVNGQTASVANTLRGDSPRPHTNKVYSLRPYSLNFLHLAGTFKAGN